MKHFACLIDVACALKELRKGTCDGFKEVSDVCGSGLWNRKLLSGFTVIKVRSVRSVIEPSVNGSIDVIDSIL